MLSFLLVLLMAVGITQPAGAGTTIFYYDNASAPDTIAYHFADIAAAFPADFVDNLTTPKTYRSKVSIQCGDTGTGTASTTLQDVDAGVWFDTAKVMLYRQTQITSWTTNLGTKVGSGNKATGRNGCLIYQGGTFTMRGNAAIYGSEILSQGGAMGFTPATSGQTFELVDCIIGNKGTSSTATIAIGTASVSLSNVYNVDLWGNIASALGLLISFNSATAERISVGINAAGSFIRSGQSTLSVKDMLFFGTPSVADIVCTTTTPAWTLVNMGWSGNAPKFGNMTVPAGGITEYRIGDIKKVDAIGNPEAGTSAQLTDVLSNVIFSGTTDADGGVTFGSGILANAVPVVDHYGSVSYLTRIRGPYTMQVGSQSYPFTWPVSANGNYEDMADVIPPASAAAPITVDSLLEASGADQIICPVP